MPAKKGTSTNFVLVDGIKFYRTAQGYYSSAKSKRLHVYIWEKANGAVPDGYDIHHIDHDKDNNSLENLECIPRKKHHADHMRERDIEQMRENLDKNVRPLASKWHGSEEGRAWHKDLYQRSLADKWGETITRNCDVCGKPYETSVLTRGHSRFCSNNCKSAWRRKQGLDLEERICIICGKPFMTNKYLKAKTCGRECGTESQRRTKAAKSRPQK